MPTLDEMARVVLGETYGGPSLSYMDGKFVIYEWLDAPVSDDILFSGDTISEVVGVAYSAMMSVK